MYSLFMQSVYSAQSIVFNTDVFNRA